MNKLLSILLSLTLIISSVVTTYAETPKQSAEKVFLDTVENTLTKIVNEAYGDHFYTDLKNTTHQFLDMLANNGDITLNISEEYNYNGAMLPQIYTFKYNDDGSSISLNMTFKEPMDAEVFIYSINLYIDDNKIVLETDDQKLVYNFGDSLAGTYFEDINVDFFKYSNIISYINFLLELETSENLDEIINDYLSNLYLYISKSITSYEDNTITLVIDQTLVKDYLTQLSTKIKNDKNLKAIYDSIELDYSYNSVSTYISDKLLDFSNTIPTTFEITYVGTVSNNVFVKNNITLTYDGEPFSDLTINFNDSSEGLLANTQIIYVDDFSNYEISSQLNNNNGEKTYSSTVKSHDEIIWEYTNVYKNGKQNLVSTGTKLSYETLFTENTFVSAPTYDEFYDLRLKSYDKDIADYESYLVYADEHIALLNTATSNTPVYFDESTDAYLYFDFYAVFYSNSDYSIYDVIDDDGKVLNKKVVLDLLKGFKVFLNEQISYSLSEKENFKLNSHEAYEYVLDYYNTYYIEIPTVEELNVNNISTIKTHINTEFSATSDKIIAKQSFEEYENENISSRLFRELIVEKSNTKNTVNLDGAEDFVEYIK